MAARRASLIDSRDGRANLGNMISRLTRILLALVTAFVFTGQMGAAAQHCARLAQAAASETAAHVAATDHDAPPCHESQAAAVNMHADMSHDHGSPDSSGNHSGASKPPPHCECIAALTGWIDIAGATTATHVEAYAWLQPAEASFASSETDPDLRPPRA